MNLEGSNLLINTLVGSDSIHEKLLEEKEMSQLDSIRAAINKSKEEAGEKKLEQRIHKDSDYELQHAAENGNLERVQELIAQGADIHADKDSALQLASRNGHYEVVKYLVEQGADVHANEHIALSEAIKNKYGEVSTYLVNQINKSTKDVSGDGRVIPEDAYFHEIAQHLSAETAELIMEECKARVEKYGCVSVKTGACKACKYRYRGDDELTSCIFGNLPCTWDWWGTHS